MSPARRKPPTYRFNTTVSGQPVQVELAIDWGDLAALMARKVHRNKSQSGAQLRGAIKARILP